MRSMTPLPPMKIRLNKALRVALLTAMLAHPAIYAEDTTFTGGDVSTDVTLTNTTTTVDYVILNSTDSQSSAQLTLEGSFLTVTENTCVGSDQNGSLKLSGGSTLDVQIDLQVATDQGSQGIVEASGEDTRLSVLNGMTLVGDAGTGALSITDSASATVNYVVVAQSAGSTGSILLSDTNSSLSVEDYTSIGYEGSGDFSIQDGASSTIQSFLYVGQYLGSEGSVEVSGYGSSLSVGSTTLVGSAGTGTLVVSNGGVANLTWLNVGNNKVGVGSVTVTGSDSSLATSHLAVVGEYGQGELTVEDCATVAFHSNLIVGNSATGNGSLTVKDHNSTLTVDSYATIGLKGTGSMIIQDGASASVKNYLCVGQVADADGTIVLTGQDSSLSVGSYTYIGFFGTGSLSIEDNASASLQNLFYIGYNIGSEGSVEISGSNSSLSVASTTFVGFAGSGNLNVSKGATANLTWLNIGQNSDGVGMVNVSGNQSSLSASHLAVVGNYGSGSLSVEEGGSASFQDNLIAGYFANSLGSISVSGNNSSLSVEGYATLGLDGSGIMTIQNAGSASVQNYLCLGLGSEAMGDAVVMGTDSSLFVKGHLYSGFSGMGSFSIESGASSTILGFVYIANNEGSQGTVEVMGANSLLSASKDTFVGVAGSGALTISDGGFANFLGLQLGYYNTSSGFVAVLGADSGFYTSAYTVIGAYGSGSLSISNNGSATIQSFLDIGEYVGSSGSLLLTDSGSSLSVGGTAIVGHRGTGTLNIENEASAELLGRLQVAENECSDGSVVVTGSGSNLSVDIDAYIGMAGDGSLSISDGGSVAIVRNVVLGKSTQEVQTGTGSIDVTGEDSRLFIGDSLALGYDDHLGAGTLTLSDGASVYVGNSIQVFGSVLSMDSSSTLTASKVIVAPGGTSSLTLGGTNSLGDIYISYEESDDSSALSLNLLASGTSVLQGGIAVCNQFQQTDHSYTAANAPSTPITSWADVSVSFDLTNDALDLIGNRIYLLKTADGHEFFDNGIVIEGVARDVSTDLVNFSKTVGDKTISFNYVYDGTSITFSDAMTVTFDQVDALDDDSISIEKTALLVSQDVVGDVDTESEPNEVVFTPTIDIQDHSEYVIAVGENAEETHFSIATTTYKQENIFTYSNAEGEVFKTEIELEDVGITDLTLYVDGTEATISGGVVGLNAEPVSTQSLLRAASIEEGTPSNLSNVLVENGGSLTLTDGNVLNADRRLIAEDGTIVLNSSTMNIGGGNLDEFRNNVYVENSDVDWDALVDSTIDHSSIQLSNGSALNFARVLDDAVTTEVVIENSSVNIGEDSSLNAGTGVDMVVRNSTILGAGKVSAFTSHNNTYTAGKNNVGVLELKNVASTNDTMGTSIVGENVISGVRNSDTANTMSQLKLSDGTTVSNGTFQLNVVGDSSLLTDGTSFQVLDLESALDGGFTNFTETGTLLMDGYVWDYSLLNSNGVVSVILAQLGDGARIANSMYSSAKAVSYAGQVAMDHLATSYTGNYGAMGNNFWISSLGTYQCVGSHSGRTGYTFQSAGYAVGFDHAFSEGVIEGMAIGQTWGKHYPKQGTAHYSAGKIDQDAMLVTLYGMESLMKTTDGQDEINLLHSISFGSVSNKSVKNALFNNKQATAKWDDDVWSIGVRGVWNHRIDDQWTLSPFVAVDYEHVSQDSFTERFNNSTAHYNGGNYQNLDVSLGASAGCTIKFDNNMELSPTASIAYVGSVLRNTPTVGVSTPTGKIVRDKAVNPGGNAIEATAGVLWKINDSTNVSANYSFYAAHDTTSHNANVMVSYSF